MKDVKGVTGENMRAVYEEMVRQKKAAPEPPGALSELFGLDDD